MRLLCLMRADTCTPVLRYTSHPCSPPAQPPTHRPTCSSFLMNQGLSMAGYSHSYSTQRRRPPESMWRSAESLRAAGASYINCGCTAQHSMTRQRSSAWCFDRCVGSNRALQGRAGLTAAQHIQRAEHGTRCPPASPAAAAAA
jgi:hypothetical protein